MTFTWNKTKATLNLNNHNLSFSTAKLAFNDPNAVYFYDEGHSTTEDRFTLLGSADGTILTVTFTVVGPDHYRIITAWRSEGEELEAYYRQGTK